MSSSESRWRKILPAFMKKKPIGRDPRLEELMSITRKGKTTASERIEPSEVFMRRSELLYRLDPLIFSGINKLSRRISGAKVYFSGGQADENDKAYAYFVSSGGLRLMPHLVKDAFIYGFGVAEINRVAGETTLTQIDPKEFDYKREGADIALDKKGNIIGYVWKNKVEETPLKPEEVFLLRFYALGDYCLGISPIEAAYKTSWVKLNIEEALGEAIYRHGFPVPKFKIGTPEEGPWHEITPEKIAEAKKIIGKLDTGAEIVLPWWMDADYMSVKGELRNVETFLEFLSMEVLAALELPKAFGVETRGVGGRAVEEMDFEKTILAFQEELKRQIQDQIMEPYYKVAKFKSNPTITFTAYAPELQNIQLRRLSAFAKNGLITRNDELENALRQNEGFPLKKKKKNAKEDSDDCIFGLGICPVRKEENMPLDKLSAFCNICVKRLREESSIKGGIKYGGTKEQKD